MKHLHLAILPALLLAAPTARGVPQAKACDPAKGPCPAEPTTAPVAAPSAAPAATPSSEATTPASQTPSASPAPAAAPAPATTSPAAPAPAPTAAVAGPAAPVRDASGGAAPSAPSEKPEARHGVALRLQALGFGREEERHNRAGLVGFGASYRYRVAKRFAFDSGLDLIGGRDNHGLEHAEMGVLVNGVFTINPQNPFRVYGIFGIGLSTARVEAPTDLGFSITPERRFYGSGVLGVGLEWCAFPFLSLNLDLNGILRQRIDGLPPPSNSVGTPLPEDTAGGMARLGAIFYFD